MAQLINVADVTGTYDGVTVDNSTELAVELTALEITKSADKAIWVRDELEYTLVVENIDEEGTGLPVDNVTVTDTIVPTVAALVPGSVTIDGVAAVEGTDYTYEPTTGLLTVLIATIAAGASHTITFRVIKV